ncbi:MAG: hypothetical protein IH885_04420 [Myxococcales bacterium]|nr:hypothetical protein [Myxococcales bacterium]
MDWRLDDDDGRLRQGNINEVWVNDDELVVETWTSDSAEQDIWITVRVPLELLRQLTGDDCRDEEIDELVEKLADLDNKHEALKRRILHDGVRAAAQRQVGVPPSTDGGSS